jgi:hypothetical protein
MISGFVPHKQRLHLQLARTKVFSDALQKYERNRRIAAIRTKLLQFETLRCYCYIFKTYLQLFKYHTLYEYAVLQTPQIITPESACFTLYLHYITRHS